MDYKVNFYRMRKLYTIILSTLFLWSGDLVWGQTCTNTASGTSCTRSSFIFGEISADAGCGVYNTVTPYSPGEYFQLPVLEGACYTVSTCGSAINTQISAFQGSATTNPFAFNDDNGPECNTTQASIAMVPSFTDYATIDVREFNCSAGGSQSITVNVRQNNNLSFTSASSDMVEGDTRTLTATPAAVTVTPQLNSGDAGTFSGTGVSGTTFTAPQPAAASGVYTITYTFGFCTTTQQITVFRQPSTSQAGVDQVICDSTVTLSGNSPQYGTGTWTIVSGSGTVTTPGSPNTTVTGLASGSSTVLIWTISNGPATPSVDTVTITRDIEPSTPDAGLDQNVCDTAATLAAISPAVGTGGWTLVGGSGTILNATDPASGVANLGLGPNTFRWTVSNGVCPPKTDDIVVTRDAFPTTAAAGVDQSICDTATVLSGNAPSTGSGTWSILSGSGSIVNATNPNSPVLGIGVGTTSLVWTITSGACPSSTDTVEIVRNAPPALPVATGLTTICQGASAQLTAGSGANAPSYLWWDQATAGNTLSSNTIFNTGPLQDTTTYYLTVTDGQTNCTSDRAPITVNVIPSPDVDLGADTTVCSNDSICLDAGGGFTSYLWSNNAQSQVNCVAGAGNYWVIVTDTNNCQGQDTVAVNTFAVDPLDIGPSDTAFCTGSSLQLGVMANPDLSYMWSNGDMTSMINVSMGGIYFLTTLDTNNCSNSDTIDVQELDVPVSSFTVDTTTCPEYQFTDASPDATDWIWSFGDGGAGSNQQDPVYDYTNAGNGSYTITLIASNICGSNTSSQTLEVNCVVGVDAELEWDMTVYPNPTQGLFRVAVGQLDEAAALEIYDLAGRMVWNQFIEDPASTVNVEVDLQQQAAGTYMVRLRVGNQSVTRRVIIE